MVGMTFVNPFGDFFVNETRALTVVMSISDSCFPFDRLKYILALLLDNECKHR